MPSRAWMFIGGVLVTAALLSVVAVWTSALSAGAWLALAALALPATAAQLLRVDRFDTVDFYAAPVFFFAGALLLPPALFSLLVVLPHLVDWAGRRRTKRGCTRPRARYIRPLNIGASIIAGSLARGVYIRLQHGADYRTSTAALAAAAAVVTYVAVNQGLLGQALVLATGRSWRKLELVRVHNLLPALTLAGLGLVVAVLWNLAPWLIVPALLPLVLLYRSPKTPRLKQDAHVDAQTGLPNARAFDKLLADEMSRAQRFDRPIALIVANVDLLRDINRAHGRQAGDKVLVRVARIIRAGLRDYDIVGRVGADKYAIVLPETGPREALLVAERVRAAIEAARFAVPTGPTPIHVTTSMGVACFPEHAVAQSGLVHEADVAAYQAKLEGRNRVVCAPDAAEPGAQTEWADLPPLEVEEQPFPTL